MGASEEGSELKTLRERAQGIWYDCAARAEEHRVSTVRWNFWSMWLGFGAAFATAVAGVSFLASAKAGTWLAIVAGALALIAAAATAANTALQPRVRADEHKRAFDAYEILRKDLRDFMDLTLAREPQSAYDTYGKLARRRRELQSEAPAIEEWARKKVRKAGGSEHFRFSGTRDTARAS
jgi:hypothetical protein